MKRSRVPHRKREKFFRQACLVTVRLDQGLPGLRTEEARRVVEAAIAKATERFGCRLTEFSVLSNHLHFLVDAQDQVQLGRAMKGLLVRLARGLNKLWGRAGRVFASRFHAEALKTLRQIRLATRYVLNNARKHGIPLPEGEPDPFSSGPWFRFWRGRLGKPFRTDGCPVSRPEGGWALIECAYVLLPAIRIDELPRTAF